MNLSTPHDLAEQVATDATIKIPLALIWQELADGTSRVVESFFGRSRCYVLVAPQQRDAQLLRGRRREIVERILSGECQKKVAIELDLSAATVALEGRLSLDALGVHTRLSRAHPLLMFSARAARERRTGWTAWSSPGAEPASNVRVLSILRPERRIADVLPSAELSVVESLVEGLAYSEIARQRQTSVRTVANQISSVFRRLHVSGRNELVHALLEQG